MKVSSKDGECELEWLVLLPMADPNRENDDRYQSVVLQICYESTTWTYNRILHLAEDVDLWL